MNTEFNSSLIFQPVEGPFGMRADAPDIVNLSDVDLRQLLSVLYNNRFVVLRTKGINKSDYVAFARRLGEPIRLSDDPDFPEIAYITNRNVDTRKSMMGAAHWHTDQSFRRTVSSITMLYSERAPHRGGETKFCNMVAAYESLPSDLQTRIADMLVFHRHGVSVSARPGDHTPIPPKGWDQNYTVTHPIVRRHPETGRQTLYAITGTSQGIHGLSNDEGADLLNRLCDHTFRDCHINAYAHQQYEIVMWDNPTTMHRATPIEAANDERNLRLLRRISLKGSPPILS